MRGRYALALSILGAYFIASYFVLHFAFTNQRAMQRATSVSGQQRMYSQRIAMFADAMATAPDEATRKQAKSNLTTSIRIFEQSHAALIDGDPNINPRGWPPPEVRHIFFDAPDSVDARVRSFVLHARALERRAGTKIATNDRDLIYLLTVGPGPLLKSLDGVVAAYNAEQRRSVARFERLQLGILALGLLTLAILWLSIFVPMEREIASRTRAMERSATLDPLTGLLNRNAFTERVATSLAHAKRRAETGAMLMIDIDHFKSINDSFGHAVGDTALVRTSDFLRTTVRTDEFVTRLGGDEFAVFAPATDDPGGTRAFVDRLTKGLEHDIVVGGKKHHVTVSVGIARHPRDGETVPQLMARADQALYAAKRTGRARSVFYENALSAPMDGFAV